MASDKICEAVEQMTCADKYVYLMTFDLVSDTGSGHRECNSMVGTFDVLGSHGMVCRGRKGEEDGAALTER